MDDPEDPVRSALADSADLYDIATWDPRTTLDRLAVRIHGGLLTGRRVVLITAAVLLFVAQVGLAALLVIRRPVLGSLGLLSVLPALLLAGYLWYDDPTKREPLETLAITFILAILFAMFAAVLNGAFSSAFAVVPTVGMALYFFVIVAPIEEVVKWLAVRVHAFHTPSFNTVVDGVVYGAVAGLGFAAIENLFYILGTYVQTAGADTTLQLQGAAQTAIGRAFVGPGHVIYSAFAGYYLGLAKFNPDHYGPIVVKGLVIAAGIHALYNTAVTYIPFTGPSFVAFVLVFDGLLLAILLRKVRRYEHHYRHVRAPEES